MGATPERTVSQWSELYLTAAGSERRLVAAALRCVARWGLAKTSLDDIAREARVSRATAYRVFPGGKDRWVTTVVRHEIGRMFAEAEAEANRTTTLEDLLCVGMTIATQMLTEHEALGYMIHHEPEAVLPHFAFHRLDTLLAQVSELSRPHLERFVSPEEVRPTSDLAARIVLSYSLRPSETFHPRDPQSIRRLVRTYLLPAIHA